MGKKKPFIDKKSAQQYHVVRRSQRDVGTEATAENLSGFVLMPTPDTAQRLAGRIEAHEQSRTDDGGNSRVKIDFDTLKSRVAAAGLADQTASTYAQFTKPIE